MIYMDSRALLCHYSMAVLTRGPNNEIEKQINIIIQMTCTCKYLTYSIIYNTVLTPCISPPNNKKNLYHATINREFQGYYFSSPFPPFKWIETHYHILKHFKQESTQWTWISCLDFQKRGLSKECYCHQIELTVSVSLLCLASLLMRSVSKAVRWNSSSFISSLNISSRFCLIELSWRPSLVISNWSLSMKMGIIWQDYWSVNYEHGNFSVFSTSFHPLQFIAPSHHHHTLHYH